MKRPKIKTEKLQAYMSPEKKTRVEKRCTDMKSTISDYLNNLIDKDLKKNKY